MSQASAELSNKEKERIKRRNLIEVVDRTPKEETSIVAIIQTFLKSKAASRLYPYLLIAPAMLILGTFVIYPIFYMIYLSFHKWDLLAPTPTFVGIENFIDLANDPEFYQVIGNTFQYVFFSVAISIVLSLLIAVYLKGDKKVNTILQSVMFAPHIVSMVSVSFIFMWLMDTKYGLFNYLLGLIGIAPVGWLDDPAVAMWSIIGLAVWKGIGYNTIIVLAALQTVPTYLYQAAHLDKASKTTIFFKITLPMISPSLFFLTLMNTISAFKVFESVNLTTNGGPLNSTSTIVHTLYEYGFRFYQIGYASAIGVVLMMILGIFTGIYFKALDKKVHYR